MDILLLSRLQFGLTAFFHFLFPPLSIGLATIIMFMELIYWRTDNPLYDRMSRFWFRLFTLTFAAGVASGITMEFQFGTNWSEYSRFVGDIFGAPLAAEGVFAFFLESTFLGLLIFGRDRISRPMRFWASFFVALGSTMSAFWIIAANSWQQTPVAYQIVEGRAVLTDFWGAIFNPSTMPRFLHTIDASYLTGAFFVMGISAFFLLRKRFLSEARSSMKIALIFALAAILAQGYLGHIHAQQVAITQPVKLAAFEGLWETTAGAPMNLFGIPDAEKETTRFEIGIPGGLSFLIYGDPNAVVTGLKAFAPEERPPLAVSYWSYRTMLILAGWMFLLVILGIYLLVKKRLEPNKLYLRAVLYSLLVPLLTCELGWIAAEFGRQPWAVYGLLKTQAAVSPVPASQVLLSIGIIVAVYSGILAAFIYLLRKEVYQAMGIQLSKFGKFSIKPDARIVKEEI